MNKDQNRLCNTFDQTVRSNVTNMYESGELSIRQLIIEFNSFKPSETLRESFMKSNEFNITVKYNLISAVA
jgi:hypothetical protein